MYNTNGLKNKLLDMEKEVTNTLRMMKEHDTGEQDRFSPTELSNYDNHPAEIGTELYQIEFNNALVVHQEQLLTEVRDALQRIEDGKYGTCALCGKDIAAERLDVIPYARVCIDCEESKTIDLEILRNERPNEELVLDAPIGRKYLNQREDDEHEGLDYLNDLMKYGSADTPQDLGGYHDYKEFYTNEIDVQGEVDIMDQISNEDYKKQLPD